MTVIFCHYSQEFCAAQFSKYSSVTDMLLELGLPSINTLLYNHNVSFARRLPACDNVLVQRVLQFNL